MKKKFCFSKVVIFGVFFVGIIGMISFVSADRGDLLDEKEPRYIVDERGCIYFPDEEFEPMPHEGWYKDDYFYENESQESFVEKK